MAIRDFTKEGGVDVISPPSEDTKMMDGHKILFDMFESPKNKGKQIMLSKTQAGSGRAVKQTSIPGIYSICCGTTACIFAKCTTQSNLRAT